MVSEKENHIRRVEISFRLFVHTFSSFLVLFLHRKQETANERVPTTSAYVVSGGLSGKWDFCWTAKLSKHLFTPVNKVKTFYVDESLLLYTKQHQTEFRRHLKHTRQKFDRVHAEPKSRMN
jgi:hypothetical protein